jgi:predicted lipoprotein with Yx(FWY)xxD motif
MVRKHLTLTRLGILTAVAAGVLLGAVLGQPGTGRAAGTAVPKNKTAPTIVGTAEAGMTLSATRGTWTGNPGSFNFAWSRCDTTGAACAGIPGATGKAYTVTQTDVGHTLRVTVTAHNSDGSDHATSAQTAIVPPSGCPAGTSTPGSGTIQVADIAPPARLVVVGASVSPSVTRSTKTLRLHIVISACNGRSVQGAVVYAAAIPFNQFAGGQGTTDANGSVTLIEARQGGFPAATHQRLLAVFVRATKPGDSVLDGVSTRRVVAFRFAK